MLIFHEMAVPLIQSGWMHRIGGGWNFLPKSRFRLIQTQIGPNEVTRIILSMRSNKGLKPLGKFLRLSDKGRRLSRQIAKGQFAKRRFLSSRQTAKRQFISRQIAKGQFAKRWFLSRQLGKGHFAKKIAKFPRDSLPRDGSSVDKSPRDSSLREGSLVDNLARDTLPRKLPNCLETVRQ
jgi:hypothetical protein